MKKEVCLVLCFCVMASVVWAQLPDRSKAKKVTDFAEYEAIDDRMNTARNYTYPRVISETERFSAFYCQDMAGPMYVALYLMENLDKPYVSQELFSEMVSVLSTYPKTLLHEDYARIYVGKYTSVTHIFCFSRQRDTITVDIYDGSCKNSVVVKVAELQDTIQVQFQIASSTYASSNATPDNAGQKDTTTVPQEFIEGCWYALWNYQWSDYPCQFEMNSKAGAISTLLLEKLQGKPWKEFCQAYESILFLEDFYRACYSDAKADMASRMVCTELVQRSLIAGM